MIVFIAVIIITLCSFYRYEIKPMDKETEEKIAFEVKTGDTWYTIGNKLYDEGLIRSSKFYKIYIKLFRPGNLKAGEYTLSKNMKLTEIMDTLENGEAINPNIIKITFKEGINMRGIAKVIAENTINTSDDVYNLLKDENYINSVINDYWFINNDIKNKDIYYSLEGYLFPSTYYIDKTKDVKTIFKVMLDQMDVELSKYKDQINESKYSVHELLTLASIVELEVGNATDRSLIAGVFYNRIANKWTLGSDVTTYYAVKRDNYDFALTKAELSTCNKYNTRGTCVVGLPVGPVSNAGSESLKAVFNPTETTDYYFVNGCDGITLTAKTETGHNNNIAKLKKENNWVCY